MIAVLVSVAIMTSALAPLPSQAAAAPPASETATQFYMRYRAAIISARSIDDILPFWSAELAREYTSAPPDQRVDVAGIKQMYATIANVKVTREAAATSDAQLSLEGVGPDQKTRTGTAQLVKEKGEWRLAAQETWHGPRN